MFLPPKTKPAATARPPIFRKLRREFILFLDSLENCGTSRELKLITKREFVQYPPKVYLILNLIEIRERFKIFAQVLNGFADIEDCFRLASAESFQVSRKFQLLNLKEKIMSEPFIGQIIMFAGNFAIRGYAMCNGQILSIAQNTALFAILGTTYGGNGTTTFGLPNLQSRVPVHFGQGPGLSPHSLGEQGGSESVTLTQPQMPQHTHTSTLKASTGEATDTEPTNQYLATGNSYTGTANTLLNPSAGVVGIAGGSQPHENLQPYLALNFLIALEGIFPSRN